MNINEIAAFGYGIRMACHDLGIDYIQPWSGHTPTVVF